MQPLQSNPFPSSLMHIMGLRWGALIQSEVGSGLSAVGKWGEWTQIDTALNKPNGLRHFKRTEKNEDAERDAQRNQSGQKRNMQTVTQKNQGTKVDTEKTFSLPPAKSKWDQEMQKHFKDPLRNNYMNKKAQAGLRQHKRTHKAAPMYRPHLRQLTVAGGLERAFLCLIELI